MRSRYAGFTMIEVMIAVVIVAILAAIALPSYRDYIQRGKITEATTNLSDLRVKLEQFYQDNRRYGTAGACGVAMPAAATVRYFTYGCVSSNPSGAGDQQFVVTANGVVGEGMANFTYTVNEANARASTITATGWTGNATCWAIKKGGTC